MVEALEERGTKEIINCDATIGALKKEVEVVEAEKTWLVGEVGCLRTAHAKLEELQKVDLLNKEVEGAKAVE